MNENIGVFIYYPSGLKDLNIIREIGFGIEEEGIPHMSVEVPEGSYHELSERASGHSQLEVGIGVDQEGNLCLHQAKLPEGFYLFEAHLSNQALNLRDFGANSARLVKGMPFKTLTK